ncbi:hypothetical protein E2C01_099625 [Portunus trituberculatus]|uniref:Uncharacterized protein n=1 Tax=Portunus trituberculatus TaxID=210409 RepID=A0A5B7K5Z8_PORTR|nr:hypothetical protein [Portunus trituberculatus]
MPRSVPRAVIRCRHSSSTPTSTATAAAGVGTTLVPESALTPARLS